MMWVREISRRNPQNYREYVETPLLSETLQHNTRPNPVIDVDYGDLTGPKGDFDDSVEHFMQDSASPQVENQSEHSERPLLSESPSPEPKDFMASPPSTPLPFDCR
ncbi:hypothetical protein PM082_019764 [Marasmius tenuissimus]|nr:hypothetical protein PM082_019764 [Marasmius tenuissimus]